jgi:hypothetical protein
MGFAPLALLLGCAQPAPEPPARASQAPQRPAAEAAPRQAGPVLQYDGRYLGPISRVGGGYSCREVAEGTRELRIVGGRAAIVMIQRGAPLQGTVREDGTLRAADTIDRSSLVTGQVINDQFVGTWQSGPCSFSLNLRRVG